jgi:regulator of sigma E protease
MTDILASAWWLIVALGILVTFHELGHYLAARWCGVKVLRFSVGFGKPIWMRTDRHGTEWAVAPIPLGGYVRMLGEHELADRVGEISDAERSQAHGSKTVGQRMLIAFAGPLANFILCIALLWLMFVIGRPDYAPVVGQAQAAAAQAGLRPGDTLVAVGERATPTWTEASMALVTAAVDRGQVPVTIRSANGVETTRRMDFSRLPLGADLGRIFQEVGIRPRHFKDPPAIVGEVVADGASQGAIRVGDRILSINGTAVRAWTDIAQLVKQAGAQGLARVELERDGRRLAVEVTPRPDPAQKDIWLLGIRGAKTPDPPMDVVLRYGPLEAVPMALRETKYQTVQLFAMVQRAFSGLVRAQDTVSGPIGIAQAANAYADKGLAWYISMLALLSLSLAVLNLLPIPVLDGGALLYYLIELVKGSPLSERAMAAGQYVGLALILGLMGLAFYNDFLRLIG